MLDKFIKLYEREYNIWRKIRNFYSFHLKKNIIYLNILYFLFLFHYFLF
jgi:hypothetical protein